MAELYLTEHGSSLHKYGNTLILRKNGKKLFQIGFQNIDRIILAGNIQFSTQILYKLFENQISLILLSSTGKFLGRLSPPNEKNIELRYSQFELHNNDAFKLSFSREIMRTKYRNSIYLLDRYLGYKKNTEICEAAAALKDKITGLDSIQSLDSLNGHEGSFARSYYNAFAKLFDNRDFFQGRSRRPPKDPANAVMSFLYTLITNRITSYLEAVGLDPYLGFYHTREYGRPSLSCDLIEPLRSVLCDRLALRAFNLRIFQKDDFENKKGGIYFKPEPLKQFFKFYNTELAKKRNYFFAKGTFIEILEHISKWLRSAILEKNVSALTHRKNI
jgi:CRISPR-associated protein Cas1